MVVVLAWIAFWWLITVASERAIRVGGVLRLSLHLALAAATLALVLFAAFSGHLGRPPATKESYLRFRVLHTILVPFLGTVSLLGWRILASRYRVSRKETKMTIAGV